MSLTRPERRGSGPALEGELLSAPYMGGEATGEARPVEGRSIRLGIMLPWSAPEKLSQKEC
jgi:hypothetical protein